MRNYKRDHTRDIMLFGSSIGQRLVLTSFGESHGIAIGAVLDGCPAGLSIDEHDIQPMLDQRRPGQSIISTQRREGDTVEIVSGTFRGHTTGAPITMMIRNSDHRSKDYDALRTKLRPGHADYTAMIKYNYQNDYRGGGRFSGRLTATHVLGGAIARKLVKQVLNMETHAYTIQIGKTKMLQSFDDTMIDRIYNSDTRCPDTKTAKVMHDDILAAKKAGDSLGGIIESTTTNVPVGLGEPIFNSLESDLSRAIFSIPSVKGVEFGSGFRGSELFGSENNDLYTIEQDKIITKTNNAGGILGGISNGMPIVMRVAFKPVSSIPQSQSTVDIKTREITTLEVKGRHDPCVVPRAPPVVDALVSLTLADHALMAGVIKPVL